MYIEGGCIWLFSPAPANQKSLFPPKFPILETEYPVGKMKEPLVLLEKKQTKHDALHFLWVTVPHTLAQKTVSNPGPAIPCCSTACPLHQSMPCTPHPGGVHETRSRSSENQRPSLLHVFTCMVHFNKIHLKIWFILESWVMEHLCVFLLITQGCFIALKLHRVG